jgi:hypothetical protein
MVTVIVKEDDVTSRLFELELGAWRDLIVETLREHRGVLAKAAEPLGLTRSNLSMIVHADEYLKNELFEIRESAIDLAEHSLLEQAERGVRWATLVLLRSERARSRGLHDAMVGLEAQFPALKTALIEWLEVEGEDAP